eukprot:PhM_4_TR8457/c5_g1_i1/m.1233
MGTCSVPLGVVIALSCGALHLASILSVYFVATSAVRDVSTKYAEHITKNAAHIAAVSLLDEHTRIIGRLNQLIPSPDLDKKASQLTRVCSTDFSHTFDVSDLSQSCVPWLCEQKVIISLIGYRRDSLGASLTIEYKTQIGNGENINATVLSYHFTGSAFHLTSSSPYIYRADARSSQPAMFLKSPSFAEGGGCPKESSWRAHVTPHLPRPYSMFSLKHTVTSAMGSMVAGAELAPRYLLERTTSVTSSWLSTDDEVDSVFPIYDTDYRLLDVNHTFAAYSFQAIADLAEETSTTTIGHNNNNLDVRKIWLQGTRYWAAAESVSSFGVVVVGLHAEKDEYHNLLTDTQHSLVIILVVTSVMTLVVTYTIAYLLSRSLRRFAILLAHNASNLSDLDDECVPQTTIIEFQLVEDAILVLFHKLRHLRPFLPEHIIASIPDDPQLNDTTSSETPMMILHGGSSLENTPRNNNNSSNVLVAFNTRGS